MGPDDRAEGMTLKRRDIVLREVAAITEELKKKKEVDRDLLEFLCAHVVRYIATLRVQGRRSDRDPEVEFARNLLESIAMLWESRSGDVPPLESEEAVLKRFLEAEDIDMMSIQFDSFAADLAALQAENAALQARLEDMVAATPKELVSVEEELLGAKDELERRTAELLRLKRRLEQEGIEIGEETPATVPGEDLVANFRAQSELIEKYKGQLREIGARYRGLQESYTILEQEKARLATEVAEWRKRVSEWQVTMNRKIQERAQELFRVEMEKESERVTRLKARDELLRRIERTNTILSAGEALMVVPKFVLSRLNVGPKDELTFVVDGDAARLVKGRLGREVKR